MFSSTDDASSGRKGDGIFYQASKCFSDRKILLVATAYLISCLAVFVHYALTKHIAIKESQSNHDPSTDGELIHAKAQLWFPTFAFATKHVIHLHLALLPLTMCRYSITRLSSTFLHRYIPFYDMMKCHIFLGYVLVGLVALAFNLFMIYYTLLCTSGDQDFCNRFSSEIMFTGYVVFALFMTVGVSSYYRNYNYQRFYRIHQIVFVAFFVSIMHTIDKIHRTQGGRSQAYKWFTMSLMIYIADRLTVSSNKGKHVTTVIGYQALNKVTASSRQVGNDNGIVVLKLAKPQSFYFKPGHHVKMKISLIDNAWHPFTIASSPDSDILEFHINVNLQGSWTYKLLDLIRARREKEDDLESIYVELMGPFGNAVAHYGAHSDALLIGSGTGFVSGLSLLQQHIEQCVSLDPSVYKMQKEKHRDLLERDGLLITRPDNLESAVIASTDDRKQAINIARNQIYKHVSMFVPFLLSFASFTLTLSWNTLAFEPFYWMEVTICVVTILSQVSFLVIAVKRGSFPTMKTCVDLLVLLLGMIGNVNWMLLADMILWIYFRMLYINLPYLAST